MTKGNRMCDIMVLTETEKEMDELFSVWSERYNCRILDCGRFDFEPSAEDETDVVAVGRYEVEFLAQVATKALRLANKAGMVRGREFVDTLERVRLIDNMIAGQPPLNDDESTGSPVIL